MVEVSSRERVLTALEFKEPDRVPIDIGATNVSAIALQAYKNYVAYKGLEGEEPFELMDIIQQLAQPSEAFLDLFQSDVRGLMPLYYANYPLPEGGARWLSSHQSVGDKVLYRDEWDIVYQFRSASDLYYAVKAPVLPNEEITLKDVEALKIPDSSAPWRFEFIEEKIAQAKARHKAIICKTLNSGFIETGAKIRGMEQVMVDLLLNPLEFEALMERIYQFKYLYWESVLERFGKSIDIIVEADDYGTQSGLIVGKEVFLKYFKPRWQKLFAMIKKRAPHLKIFFHSCGAVREIIPEFIEMGVDILNPIQFSADGMEKKGLKKDFGRDIVFWGGGIDTQRLLPQGSPEEIREAVKRTVDELAPGGGWVFATVHNVQADVPPENLEALRDAIVNFR
ncbi:MAG: uroporphyrinogen decarboxylase family protein [Sphaerochaetaceae bacterium]